MATVTKTIGTTGRDYSTIALWEADLDNDTPYDAGDDAIGECYDDSVFDEGVSINGGGTLGLTSRTLTVAVGERHDGTAGTGARMVASSRRKLALSTVTHSYVYWLEWDENGITSGGTDEIVEMLTANLTAANMLIHDQTHIDNTGFVHGVDMDNEDNQCVLNCIIYNLKNTVSGGYARGIIASNSGALVYIYNCTIYNIDSDVDAGYGIYTTSTSNKHVKNCIVCDTAGADFTGAAPADHDYNLSSDATAIGTNSLTSKTAANQFVSTVSGSEDLHLKSGADAIDEGVDLGTTPTGVNIDINGRDRDSEGDTWDMGAHEYLAAAPEEAIMNQFQGANIGADLFNGALL